MRKIGKLLCLAWGIKMTAYYGRS